jgi:cytochrome c-type biogenesis protein CcmE
VRGKLGPRTPRQKTAQSSHQRMKPKHKRLIFILGCIVIMALGATVILSSLRDTMVYFYTPSELDAKRKTPDFHAAAALRIGGLVKKGSIKNLKEGGIRFIVTDLSAELPVTYRGLVPSLFRDGQGIVAQGTLDADGTMNADTILAKHDETYMPRQVVDQLKASGRWDEDGTYKKVAQ